MLIKKKLQKYLTLIEVMWSFVAKTYLYQLKWFICVVNELTYRFNPIGKMKLFITLKSL